MPGDTEASIEASLRHIIGHSSRQRIQALCEGYIASGNYKEISNTLATAEGLEGRL